MSFDYNKHKNQDHGSFWTSYSDLFLGMSVVFLLLYVTSSLRTGANGIQTQMENQRLSMKVQDLQNQMKMYESVKKDYLAGEATQAEEQQYNELMDKLTLLKEEAKDEKNRLNQAANENAKKEQALNQYQQMVRNVINANLISKTKIKTRDTEINEQDSQIVGLEKDVNQKENQIAENEKKIAQTKNKLENSLNQLKVAFKQKKMTEAAYQAQVKNLKNENNKKINGLLDQNDQIQEKLVATRNELQEATGELDKTKNKLGQTVGELDKTKGELGKTKGQLGQLAGELDQTKGQLGSVASELGKTKGQLGQVAGELEKAKDELGTVSGELGKTKGQLGQMAGELDKTKGELGQTKGALKDTEGLLERARAEADARKSIAKDIREGFKKAGVSADINDQTGEVVINFDGVYFDNDSSKLKEKMKDVLNRAMPVYSKSLLGNAKVASKIASVEIIGFASPTYQGKIIDPSSVTQKNKNAVNYNLDLSFGRARSIFQYVFDDSKLKFDYQKNLLPLIKVTGRSFLADKLPAGRSPSAKGDFCAEHDCRKAQRVIIKFSFEDNKK